MAKIKLMRKPDPGVDPGPVDEEEDEGPTSATQGSFSTEEAPKEGKQIME